MEHLVRPAFLKLAHRCGELEADCALKNAYIEQLQGELQEATKLLDEVTEPDDGGE